MCPSECVPGWEYPWLWPSQVYRCKGKTLFSSHVRCSQCLLARTGRSAWLAFDRCEWGVAAEYPWVPLMPTERNRPEFIHSLLWSLRVRLFGSLQGNRGREELQARLRTIGSMAELQKRQQSSQRRNKIPGLEVRMPKVFRSIGLCRKDLPPWWLVETPSPLHLKTFQIIFLHEAGAT